MNLIYDVWNLISSLSIMDYILYFSVIVLIILVVSLIYVMQEEKLEAKKEIGLEKNEPKAVLPEKEELDLSMIVDTIDENPKPLIDMTAYEEEQEQKAIISYEELIQDVKQKEINYEKEEMVDDIIPVKRISISPIEKPSLPKLELIEKEPKIEVSAMEQKEESKIKLFSYEKEEAFLKALQQLNELLN